MHGNSCHCCRAGVTTYRTAVHEQDLFLLSSKTVTELSPWDAISETILFRNL